MSVSFAVFRYVGRSIPWVIAGNAEPCPRHPRGGNFEWDTTALASSTVLIWGTTMPLDRFQWMHWKGQIAYCAPASRALLIKSEWVILRRTSGDTPIAAIAAVEECIESSLICPCSQSMMMPLIAVSGNSTIDEKCWHQRRSGLLFELYETMEAPKRSWSVWSWLAAHWASVIAGSERQLSLLVDRILNINSDFPSL